ncbi:MAG: aspartate aminotransferase family protein, partial [Terracidiphilus sp.]
SKELHLGEISLECSRAGAAAVALWATQRLLPLKPGGEFARGLAAGRAAALDLDRRLRADRRFEALTGGGPELDIVVWKPKAATAALASELGQSIFSECARRGLHLALVQLPQFWFEPASGASAVEGLVTCLRSVLMKPEHQPWLDRIWNELSMACAEVEKG